MQCGIHGLHAAKVNCTVWVVEPQEKNLQKIIHSSILSGVINRMTFVQNAVDGVRRKVQMVIDDKNNGGSYIKELDDPSRGAVEAVLLSDIFNEALLKSQPKSVVIKADIESYECRAFLNSPQVFEHPSIESVIFEWFGVSENCSAEDFKRVLKLLKANGLKPYLSAPDRNDPKRYYGHWSDASDMSDDQIMDKKGANLFWSKINL